jgi:hypothetical protein
MDGSRSWYAGNRRVGRWCSVFRRGGWRVGRLSDVRGDIRDLRRCGANLYLRSTRCGVRADQLLCGGDPDRPAPTHGHSLPRSGTIPPGTNLCALCGRAGLSQSQFSSPQRAYGLCRTQRDEAVIERSNTRTRLHPFTASRSRRGREPIKTPQLSDPRAT